MQSIHHYSNILNSLTTINGQIVSLDYLFREVEASTDIDTQFVDSFVASAQEMIAAAEALKSVVYDPTPE